MRRLLAVIPLLAACGGPAAQSAGPSPATSANPAANVAPAQVATASTLSSDGARALVAAAEAAAKTANVAVAIAVVDDTGEVLVVARMDDGAVGDVRVAMAKARTAALFRKPTSALEKSINDGRKALAQLEDVVPVAGASPIAIGPRTVGALAVSGATPEVEATIVETAIRTLVK